jgi:hypothetical protein
MPKRHAMRAGWRGAAALVVGWAGLFGLTVGAGHARPEWQDARPPGWQAATHGDAAPPDYRRLFSMDRVHELRIVIPADQFRAMQEDLRTTGPAFARGLAGMAAGRAGGPNDAGAAPDPAGFFAGLGPDQLAAFGQGAASACAEKAVSAACSVAGVNGQCTDVGPGRSMCLPDALRNLAVGLRGRGAGGLSMTSRDPMYVPVSVEHDGRVWTRVGMRYKGNSSLFFAAMSNGGKIPFRLDFDRYEDVSPEIRNQRFYGFEKLTFSSNFGDDSQIRELFATEVFRDRGVPAARAAFYRVFVDTGGGPAYWGLYTMIEDPADGAMLESQFGGRGGNLYKPDGRGANFTEFAREGFPKKTNEKRDDFSDVEAAISALHAAPGPGSPAWRAALEARFDADHFLRWLAVNTAIQNWDAYGTFAHNYYLYGDPGQKGRLRWIPWDHNFALGAGIGGGGFGPGGPPMFGGGDDILHTRAGSQWPLISRLLADEVYAARYREHLARALEGLFAPDAAVRRMQQLHAMIAASVADERPGHTTISSREGFERAIDGPGGLREVVQQRHDAVRKALAAAAGGSRPSVN